MSSMKIAVCKPGLAQAQLRSEPRVDPETDVGDLPPGMSLDVVQPGGAWHACRAYVSASVSDAAGGFVAPKPSLPMVNVRRTPHLAKPYDVGDLRQGQKLETIERAGDWWVVRVFVSAGESNLVEVPTANGFDAPVGTAEERAGQQVWPGNWEDPTGYARHYEPKPGRWAYHTGADLNLNLPRFDLDAHAPCYAPAAGIVRAANDYSGWGNVITIEHELPDGTHVWSRLGHLESMRVDRGQIVARGQEVGRIGDAFGNYPYHLHFDIASIDLGRWPDHWPGDNLQGVKDNYYDPLVFTLRHRPGVPSAAPKLLIGMHDEAGGRWMKNRNLTGVCLVLVTVQQQAVQVDLRELADAGITVLMRIGYGYADGTGTLPPPDRLNDFEKAVIGTLRTARGVTATHYGNEMNNIMEHPGWDPRLGTMSRDYFALTPEYYIASYNRVWSVIPVAVKMGPGPIDPYFGPGSDNRVWWQAILGGIRGADAIFLHSKTQYNDPGQVRSREKFAHSPLQWQYLHFRTIENSLEDLPPRFKSLPVYVTEANPQRIDDGQLGWKGDNAAWIDECVSYLRDWNNNTAHQPVQGVVFYRWQDDWWALQQKNIILDRVAAKAME